MSNGDNAGDRYWSVVAPFWLPLNESWDHVAEFLAESQRIPPRVLDLYAAHWCQSEVNNGGLHQFFFNTTGLLAPEATSGFRAIGLPTWSAVVSEAMGYFSGAYPRERAVRRKLLPQAKGRKREVWDPFQALDERFFTCSDAMLGRWEQAADLYVVPDA